MHPWREEVNAADSGGVLDGEGEAVDCPAAAGEYVHLVDAHLVQDFANIRCELCRGKCFVIQQC